MKSKFFIVFTLGCALAVGGVLLLWPEGAPRQAGATPFIALSRVPVLEIPATAAELVHSAPDASREDTARKVVRAVSSLTRPGALPFVVSSICRGNPEVSGAVVGTATELQQGDAQIFCKAALSAAPAKVYQIVYEACQAAPIYSAAVALTASKQLPSADDLIMAAFANARPEFEPFLEKAQIQVGPDFEATLKQTVALFNQASANPK